ncbi:hypothetical protein BDV12DRAFT_203094 [Aspergillus spectabilis]
MNIWAYLNHPVMVWSHREFTVNVGEVFEEIELRFNDKYPTDSIDVVNAWDLWHHDMLQYQAQRTYNWVIETIRLTETVWLAVPNNNAL